MYLQEKLLTGCVILFVVLGVIVPIILYLTGLHINTGSGIHTGYVTAVEKTGIIFKTGRAYIKTDLSSSQEDTYCVIEEAVYDELAERSKNKEQVTASHFSWFSAGVKNCDGEGAVINNINN